MKPLTKLSILLVFCFTLIILSSCTPTPACEPVYNVTKTDDTNDGVCSAGDCSLREAILNANVCPGSHTINLPAGGYTLSIDGDDEDLGETGDLDITDDLTIIGSGAPSIHGGIERSIHIHSGATVVLDQIWLADGDAIYGGGMINEGNTTLTSFTCNYNTVTVPEFAIGDAMGGCIFNTGSLEIDGAEFLWNEAGQGGAIYNYDSAVLNIEDADFNSNHATDHGGAIWNGLNSTLTINGGEYRLNWADLNGGVIWNHGTVTAENITLDENQAGSSGGGFYNWSPGSGYFTNSYFTLNLAEFGGGIYNNEGLVHLYQSGLASNMADIGAGIYNEGPTPPAGLFMRNVTLSYNDASGKSAAGGGIYNNSNFDLRFITLAHNEPDGINIVGGSEIKIRSSILAYNNGANCVGIPPDSLDYNIEDDGTCGFVGTHDLTSTDPLLEPWGYYGSLAPSHPLNPSSPALDSGVPDLCTAIDQNGTTRPQGLGCDRGAYENPYLMGIIRGWTYIDSNRNDFRDPDDGAISGANLILKEGACPGGVDLLTVTSDSPTGYYEILDIDPGDYCLARSMIQQTLYPDYHDISISPGDVFNDVNFRYLLSPAGDSSLAGLVWHDLCAVPYGMPPTPPPGCITLSGGGLGADGVYDPAEPGIEGVRVNVYGGSCPGTASAIAGSILTDPNGEFVLPALTAGTWCLSVDALATPNDTILIPGNWTYPDRNLNPAEHEVVLGSSEDLVDLNFGWDYQFLPEPLLPYSYICTINQDAFGRMGPGTGYPEEFIGAEGEIFEVLARSEIGMPLWYYGKHESGKEGWMSEVVLDCEEIDPEQLFIREAPPMPKPEETEEPLVCSRDLNQQDCIATGGTWYKPVTHVGDPYCVCPED